MVTLGMANSRLKDFFDVHELARQREFDGAVLAAAIRDTFARRRTALGPERPQALTPAFGGDSDKQDQWRAFLRKNRLTGVPQELAVTVDSIAIFLGPVLDSLASGQRVAAHWPAGGPWGPQ